MLDPAILHLHVIDGPIMRLHRWHNFTFIWFEKPPASINKLKTCISDIQGWMINNKLKINHSKSSFHKKHRLHIIWIRFFWHHSSLMSLYFIWAYILYFYWMFMQIILNCIGYLDLNLLLLNRYYVGRFSNGIVRCWCYELVCTIVWDSCVQEFQDVFVFWDVVYVCLQNSVGECCVCNSDSSTKL